MTPGKLQCLQHCLPSASLLLPEEAADPRHDQAPDLCSLSCLCSELLFRCSSLLSDGKLDKSAEGCGHICTLAPTQPCCFPFTQFMAANAQPMQEVAFCSPCLSVAPHPPPPPAVRGRGGGVGKPFRNSIARPVQGPASPCLPVATACSSAVKLLTTVTWHHGHNIKLDTLLFQPENLHATGCLGFNKP